MKIGYIGLGALGSELARRFATDHELWVWDINASAIALLEKDGAKTTATAALLGGEVDVLLLCLPRSADVRQLLFGTASVARALKPGTLVIDQTSGIPAQTRAMADELAHHGILMMDAAVSASPHIVSQGGATLMASGPAAVVDRAMPVLGAITQTIYRCGDRVGDGQAIKMVNNAINAVCRLGTLEVVALGRKARLSLEKMTEVLNGGRGGNQTTEKMLPAIAKGVASTNFSLPLMLKDMNQAAALGIETQVAMPLVGAARALFQIGLNTLGMDSKLEDMIGVIEKMADIRLADPAPQPALANDSTDADRTAALMDAAVATISRLATYECVVAGAKYGLELRHMADIINKSSGWSKASREALPSLLEGRQASRSSLGGVADELRLVAELGIDCGAPTTILSVARSLVELAASRFGNDASIEDAIRLY